MSSREGIQQLSDRYTRDINPIDYATLAVSSTAVSLNDATPPLPGNAKGAIITVETDQIRYREDGTVPTSSEGILLNAGDILTYPSWAGPSWKLVMEKVRFIRVTNDAALKIQYYD